MWQEGQNVVGAGSDTTASALSIMTFQLLNNPDKLRKLQEELRVAAALLPNGKGWDLVTTRQLSYLVCFLYQYFMTYLVNKRNRRVSF